MRITVTLAAAGREETDLLIDCDDATPSVELAAAMAAQVGCQASELSISPRVRIGASGLEEGGCAGDLGLREAMRIVIGARDEEPAIPSGVGLQIHVVGGPDSGRVFALTQGVHELGRSGVLSWHDGSLSRRHCQVVVSPTSVTVRDLGSSNGTRLDGVACGDAPSAWLPGQLLEIGDSLVELRGARGVETTVEPAAETGWLNFMRPPRIQPSHVAPAVEVPRAPTGRSARKIPLIAVVVPLLFGVVMAAVLKNPTFLLFGLMSPVMMISNVVSERRGDARDHKAAVADYAVKLADSQRQLDQALSGEQHRLREELPDAGQTFLTCTLPGRRLWERRRHDPDVLSVRIGTSDLPSTVKMTGADAEAHGHRLHAVPVGLDLPTSTVVGLAGPDDVVDGVLRWVIAQLVAAQAPRDLSLSFLTTRGGREWNWLRWLPHLRPVDPESCAAMIGNDVETLTAQVAALSALVKSRKDLATDRAVTADSFAAHVVVLHGYREMRGILGLGQVLDDGPAVGVYAICTDDSDRSLPERCTATVVVDATDRSLGELRRAAMPTISGVLLEQVAVSWCDHVARAVSPLKDVGAAQDGESLPESARLLDVVGLEPPTPDAIRARWAVEPASTSMTVGVGLDGPFALDLRSDGPHGLIAGMTGSGKTELLQTIIASLAIANRPDEMNFVLVDYKGDSAFKDCVRLPHTVGKVNDLDAHLVERALASLQAELKHREHFLAAAGTKDIEDYQLLHSKEPHRVPMPRLVLVIDEFAQLVKDLPEFVTGLVSIAQLGRSLGIHLLLATQRPSGVVSADIRANTNLRIALRVADSADSTDVLQTADAARIAKSAPGRAYARLGAGALLAFQSGRVGGRRPGAVVTELPAPFLARVDWRSVGYRSPQPPRRAGEESSDTDLAALVATVVTASELEQIPTQRRPWLEALPERLLLSDLLDEVDPRPSPATVNDEPTAAVTQLTEAGETTGPVGAPGIAALPYGRSDLPAQQRQVIAAFDLDADGHLLAVGSSRSGRSQLLRNLAASAATLVSPADLHVYGIDCGGGALAPLVALPHCGAVVNRTETERAARLLLKLAQEVDERQRVLAADGFSDIGEQRRAATEPLPHLMVLIDRWEGFTTTLGEADANTDAVTKMLREGASVGVHVVITGDRTLASNGRVSSMTENKLALRLADRADYTLLGLQPRQLPDRIAPGRCFAPGAVETQIALLDLDDAGQAQSAAINRIGAQARERAGQFAPQPFRVDVLPTMLRLDQALAYLPAPSPGASPVRALVGVGGDELTGYVADLERHTSFIVAGPGRSGRSSVLTSMAGSVLASGAQVICMAPRPSPLRDLGGVDGVLGVLTDPAEPSASLDGLVARASKPVVILIDDGEGLRDCGAAEFYLRVVKGFVPDVSLVLSGDADGLCAGLSGWQVEAKKARCGLMLSPQGITDGDLIGIRLPRSVLGGAPQPGRGWLHLGDAQLRQVATALP